ncbi:MAG: thioredoxin 1 [Clostridiales bacterium]|nr:thioredoxin 1 [Clostridiales bacterium]
MLELNKENFEQEVLKADGIVIVDYWGEGCSPCQALMPDFEALAQRRAADAKFGKLNTTQERRLALSQRVLGLPTIVLYKNGARVAECTKEKANPKDIEAMLDANL